MTGADASGEGSNNRREVEDGAGAECEAVSACWPWNGRDGAIEWC